MIYDISQPVFECVVFPGDPSPKRKQLSSIDDGKTYNLTEFSMCAHNGTHVDAPLHFLRDGKSVDQINLEKFVGPAYVKTHEGVLLGEDAKKIIDEAKSALSNAEKRILIKGNATISLEAAKEFIKANIDLIGNESQTVGPEDSPMEVHLELLNKDVVLLEGIRLSHVSDGAYFLNCAPINLNGAEGAPCRAILMDIKNNNR